VLDWNNLKQLRVPDLGELKEVVKVMCDGDVLWERGGLPSIYQQVEWIKAENNVGAYIDLGFAFDTAATIYIEQFLESTPQWLASTEQTYIFGAAESNGKYRCMFTSPNNQYGSFIYGSDGTTYINAIGKFLSIGKNRLKFVYQKGDLYWKNLDTDEISTVGTKQIEYTMSKNLFLFAQNYNGKVRFSGSGGHVRKLGLFSYYDKNDTLICDLIPCCRKSDGVIGMYDLARGLFLTNVGTGYFEAGPEISGGY